MFESLFGSKTRVKLLSLFLNNPDRSYYVREITRKIDEQINSVRRELSNLLTIGIVRSESQQNKLYYEANPKYEYYDQLRTIFANIPIKPTANKTAPVETKEDDEIAKKLRSAGNVELAFLTGAFVRQQHVGIDLFILGDVNRSKVANIISELERDMGKELNYTIMNQEEYSYRLSLNDRFLSNIMDAKKIKLIDSHDQDKPLDHKVLDLEIEAGATPVPVKHDVED